MRTNEEIIGNTEPQPIHDTNGHHNENSKVSDTTLQTELPNSEIKLSRSGRALKRPQKYADYVT